MTLNNYLGIIKNKVLLVYEEYLIFYILVEIVRKQFKGTVCVSSIDIDDRPPCIVKQRVHLIGGGAVCNTSRCRQ